MRAAGGHDERLIMHEHLESSLRLMMNGGRLTYEPTARVMYRAFVPFKDEDWPYFLFRWALHRAETSDRVFAENWGVYKDLAASQTGWARKHRERAMRTTLPRLPELLGAWTDRMGSRETLSTADSKARHAASPTMRHRSSHRSHPRTVWKRQELN